MFRGGGLLEDFRVSRLLIHQPPGGGRLFCGFELYTRQASTSSSAAAIGGVFCFFFCDLGAIGIEEFFTLEVNNGSTVIEKSDFYQSLQDNLKDVRCEMNPCPQFTGSSPSPISHIPVPAVPPRSRFFYFLIGLLCWVLG